MKNNISDLSPQMLLENSREEVCENCQGQFFRQVIMLRRVSKLVIGAPHDQMIPIPVFRCDDCLTPVADMVPRDNPKPGPTEDNDDSKIISLNGE